MLYQGSFLSFMAALKRLFMILLLGQMVTPGKSTFHLNISWVEKYSCNISYTGKSLVSRLVLVGLWMYLLIPSENTISDKWGWWQGRSHLVTWTPRLGPSRSRRGWSRGVSPAPPCRPPWCTSARAGTSRQSRSWHGGTEKPWRPVCVVTPKGLLVITLITWTLPRIIGLSPFITLVSCLFNVTIFHLEGDSWIINSVDTDCGVDTIHYQLPYNYPRYVILGVGQFIIPNCILNTFLLAFTCTGLEWWRVAHWIRSVTTNHQWFRMNVNIELNVNKKISPSEVKQH